MPNKQTTWVVVADSCQAKIYHAVKPFKLEEIAFFEHPESRLHNQDLVTSKPGRTFQSGGVTRHAYETDVSPKQAEAIKFAIEIAHHLSSAESKGEFGRLYVIAEPSFLGLLRQHTNPQTQKTIVAEIPKDLTHSDLAMIEHQLSEL